VRLDDLVVGQNHVVGVRVGGAAHQTYENHVAKLEPDVQYKGTLVIIVDYKKCDKYPYNDIGELQKSNKMQFFNFDILNRSP
jgi:hypothetical protein